MFCGCSAAYADAPPNTHVCPVCLALPGVLPVINRKAVEFTIMTGLALNCEIPAFSKFDRKNYPYPDLMKGYQISQYDLPLSQRRLAGDRGRRRGAAAHRHHARATSKRTRRACTHKTDGSGETYSLIDVNRSGVPLMEIVGEPDMRSPAEARAYLVKLRQILRYIGVSKANMEEGNFRCDANISLRPIGATEFGSKVEVKNMNSFRAVYSALQFEVERQTAELDAGRPHRAGDARLGRGRRQHGQPALEGAGARLPLLPRAGPAARHARRRVRRRASARSCRSCRTRSRAASSASTACRRTRRTC